MHPPPPPPTPPTMTTTRDQDSSGRVDGGANNDDYDNMSGKSGFGIGWEGEWEREGETGEWNRSTEEDEKELARISTTASSSSITLSLPILDRQAAITKKSPTPANTSKRVQKRVRFDPDDYSSDDETGLQKWAEWGRWWVVLGVVLGGVGATG